MVKKKKSAKTLKKSLSVKFVKTAARTRKKAFHKQIKPAVRDSSYRNRIVKSVRRYRRRLKRWSKATELTIVELKPVVRRYRFFIYTFLVVFCVFSSLFYWFILRDLPSPDMLVSGKTSFTTTIRDRNGIVLYRIYKNTNRIKLDWDQIPQVMKQATVAIEDASFYSHAGVSAKAIMRAFLYNLDKPDMTQYQGGSTITQQLVKNRLLGPEKTYTRKIKEIVLALLTERTFPKQKILNMYLNEVGYGGPAYGVGAASLTYFGIPASNLDLAQAAFLAGLPAAPTTFSPFGVNSNLSTIRQHEVLDRMLKLGMINKDQYQTTINEKLVFAPQKIDILAPHFVMYVKNQLVEKMGEGLVEEGGLDVTTTLDYNVQKMAEETVRKNIAGIKDRFNIHNAATLVTNPSTGEILAMVGSADYWDTSNKGYVNVANSFRQPGSSIKLVNYAYAFDHGWTPNSVLVDSPVVYVAPGSRETYAPVNYDGTYHGTVTLRSALANSYNVPAVKLLNSYGVQHMIDLGKMMGIKSWNHIPPVGLSLTLGGAEVTMLDMARAYGTIANLGTYKDLKVIKEIKNSNEQDITDQFYYTPEKDLSMIDTAQASENKQVVSPLASYWLTDILSDNVARLPAFGPYAKLAVPGHKVAVKTGTSNNFRDNWTIGFSPDYLVATWVGNTDGQFMNKNLVSGITGAAPIWNETMTNLLANVPDKEFPRPEGLIPVKVCAVNGLLTCPYCPQEKVEYFTADKVPTRKCYFKSPQECDEAKKQAEGKSDEEKKILFAGCAVSN